MHYLRSLPTTTPPVRTLERRGQDGQSENLWELCDANCVFYVGMRCDRVLKVPFTLVKVLFWEPDGPHPRILGHRRQ